jgi:hypothetical protein
MLSEKKRALLEEQREAAVQTVKECERAKEAHGEQGFHLTNRRNLAEQRWAEAKGVMGAVRGYDPDLRSLTRREIKEYERQVNEAVAAHNKCVDEKHAAHFALVDWSNRGTDIELRRRHALQEVGRIEWEIDRLSGNRKPRADPSTGLVA